MFYLFDSALQGQFQKAFAQAFIEESCSERSNPTHRDYLFFKFLNPVDLIYDEKTSKTLIDILMRGDQTLSESCNQQLQGIAIIEAGFRWAGNSNTTPLITVLGFAIKIIYTDNKVALRECVIDIICNTLNKGKLLSTDTPLTETALERLSTLRTTSPLYSSLKKQAFFKSFALTADIMAMTKNYIAGHIAPIHAKYIRPNEGNINPTYEDAAFINYPLKENQKKIWLLRTDFIVAIGNKNAYWTTFDENNLARVIDRQLHRFLNWEDRFGHPSLAIPYDSYDGSAYYGGLLAQRNGYLEVYTSTGRFYRNDLSDTDRQIMEAYLAYHFQRAFGAQPICFVSAPSCDDYFEISFFYADKPLPSHCSKRIYQEEAINGILMAVEPLTMHQFSPHK